jgi:hypothetical protein
LVDENSEVNRNSAGILFNLEAAMIPDPPQRLSFIKTDFSNSSADAPENPMHGEWNTTTGLWESNSSTSTNGSDANME